MADSFKQMIPTANRKKTKKSYDFNHIMTTDFMRAVPVMCREVIPNQDLKIGVDSFCRLNPLVKPTFGRARVNQRLFFVPMRTIMPRWSEFLASEPIYSLVDNSYGLQTSVPIVYNAALVECISSTANLLSTNTQPSSFDFCMKFNGDVLYYEHTDQSLYFLSILMSLGYRLDFNLDLGSSDPSFSALPILAWAKIMIDWYYPSAYINSSAVQAITPLFLSDSLSAKIVTTIDLYALLDVVRYVSYNDSLYVDAWDRPVAPNNGVESQYSIPDVTYSGGAYQANSTTNAINTLRVDNALSDGTPLSLANVGAGSGSGAIVGNSITQYQHDVLKALTDYTTRHRLAGVRAVDRLLAEYGINLSSEIMKRSLLLGSDTYNIQFGDVMSHTDTYNGSGNTGAILGDYAGKGIGYGNHTFAYNIGDEFGYLILVNSIIPDVDYYQGIDRIVKHKSILDFYHADFDGLGVQAVAQDEVYNPDSYMSGYSSGSHHSGIFGFTPRYSEYKIAQSCLTGLFSVLGNEDVKAYSFMRDLSHKFGNNPASIIHGVDFVEGRDSRQYNRIFYAYDVKPDSTNQNFIFITHFEVTQNDEMTPLYDTYDFKNVERAVEVHTQASKVN